MKWRRWILGGVVATTALLLWGSFATKASDPITGVWVTASQPPARAVFDPSGRYQFISEKGAKQAGKWRASKGQVSRLSYLDSRGEVEGWDFVLLEKPEDAAMYEGKEKSLTPMPDFRGYILTPEAADRDEMRFFLVEGRLWGNPLYYKRPGNAFATWWEGIWNRARPALSP